MDKATFDANRKGLDYLPFSAHALRFATCRSVEISALTRLINTDSSNKLVFQTLPPHMRRRAMSHKMQRLPTHLRKAQTAQFIKSSGTVKTIRQSRKHRRRPKNLLEEYNRRKKNNMWLETHIWHAKRFRMVERWGYKIAYAPRDKAFRACYRASSAHCLIQDVSYHVQIMIVGDVNIIREKFKNVTNSKCNLGICAQAYISGSREGTIHLYKPNAYPFGYIGKINYLWQPEGDTHKKLLLFVHPSMAVEIKKLLMDLFETNNKDDDYIVPEKKQKLANNSEISVRFLDNTFNIFRLIGPLAQAVLAKTLETVQVMDDIKSDKWVEKYLQNSETDLKLTDKCLYWWNIKVAQSPAEMPSKIVAGLIVRDPRLMRPNKRMKAVNCASSVDTSDILNVPDFAPSSPLWDLDILNTIKDNIVTNTKFIEHVTEAQLIPGSYVIGDPKFQSVPIILVQKPGSRDPKIKRLGYGSGWDIIVPPDYGMFFWQTFMMFGARSGGLRENEHVTFESGECHYSPDSNAGVEEESRIEQELRHGFFKVPPNKRMNYIKLGVNSPFICQWKLLLSDWSSSKIDEFYVLRETQSLVQIQESIKKKVTLPQIEKPESCLIPVYIKVIGRGAIKKHSLLCLPKVEDVSPTAPLQEPMHEDENEIKRKEMRKEHKLELRRIRRKNIKIKDTLDSGTKKMNKLPNNEPSEYVKKMRELWVPSTIESVRYTNSRELMGYLTHAAYSYTEAHPCGVGYISYNACQALIDTKLNFMLVRNTTTRKYRKCTFSVIMNK